MYKYFLKLFVEHPATQGETYLQHARFAFAVGTHCAIAAVCFFVHGFFPFVSAKKPFDLQSTVHYLKHKCENRKGK